MTSNLPVFVWGKSVGWESFRHPSARIEVGSGKANAGFVSLCAPGGDLGGVGGGGGDGWGMGRSACACVFGDWALR